MLRILPFYLFKHLQKDTFTLMNLCQTQTVQKLVLRASEMMSIEPSLIVGHGKKEEVCIARAMVWVVCKVDLSLTYRDIAEYFNKRHWTTVESGYQNMKKEIEVNRERHEHYKHLASNINEMIFSK